MEIKEILALDVTSLSISQHHSVQEHIHHRLNDLELLCDKNQMTEQDTADRLALYELSCHLYVIEHEATSEYRAWQNTLPKKKRRGGSTDITYIIDSRRELQNYDDEYNLKYNN